MTVWQANSGWVLELPRCLEELAGKQCFFHDSSETIQFHSQPWHLHVRCLQLLRTCLWNSFLCTTCLWNSFRDKLSLVKKTSSTAVIEITHLLISYRLKAATQLHKRHGRLHNHLLLTPTRWMGYKRDGRWSTNTTQLWRWGEEPQTPLEWLLEVLQFVFPTKISFPTLQALRNCSFPSFVFFLFSF